MSGIRFTIQAPEVLECRTDQGTLLLRYVAAPATPSDEAPRPYAHPVCSLSGEVLTNFRPNDHPWHHGLSLTINHLDGWNFWGGPTYRRGRGYEFQSNHGTQRHVAWEQVAPEVVIERLEWMGGAEKLLDEERRLTARLDSAQAWSLRWQSRLHNATTRALVCANYHSGEGLAGSHYTGLQFRGARELLDDHGDRSITLLNASGHEGEGQVHGAAADWLEWRTQKDGSLRRVTIRFSNAGSPLHWFVRRHNPLVAFPFHYASNFELPPGGVLELDHTLTFAET
jgi:hypothetical protein